MNGNALAGSVPQQQNQVVSPVPAQPTSAALNRPKRAPNAEHTVVEIDPQIQALCRTFSIEDRIARRLNEVMLTREETFDEDMKALWEVCENAKPSGFLMVKILELERGVFTGAGKLNREIASFASKFKLDDRALSKLIEVFRTRKDTMHADLRDLERHLKTAQHPSSATISLLVQLKANGRLPSPVRSRGRREEGRQRERSWSRSRSRSKGR